MNKTLAHITSALLHPMLIPTYGLLTIFHTNNSMIMLPIEAKRIILLIVGINTLILPLLMIPLFHRLGIVKSIQMQEHRERIVPVTFTLIPYIFSFYFLKRLPIPNEISTFMLGATITIALILLISIWWKISIHMVGIGGLVGLTFALSQKGYYNMLWVIIIAIALSGIIAWARLALKAHNAAQVYAGFALGWVTVALCVILV
ncbi:MAG: phosphatase PAP2 family protein [Tenuifilaceae bacterium]|jgi:membrane-associated phospholipid phosphatase|nr:phosphatase PAP2 family protein [Tenuifilaceae bacterium]